jgi:uncharacterized protein YhdP
MAMAEEKTKKKGLGCLGRLIIFVFVIIVVAVLAGKLFFPAERVRAEIVKRASESLGRTVELDAVSFSVLPRPSVELKGLRVFNPENFPGGEMLSLENLSLAVKIMPLLKGQFIFTEIKADRPVLNLRKTADGKTNYEFEVKTGEKPIETPLGAQAEGKKTVTSKEAALTVFAFDWAEIRNADIIYIDDSAKSRVVLNNLSLDSRLAVDKDGKTGQSTGTIRIPSVTSTYLPEGVPLAVNLTYNADIDFQNADLVFKDSKLEVNGIVFDIDATVRNILDPISVYAAIKADGVDMAPLMQYLPSSESFDPKSVRLQGKLDGNVEARMEFAPGRKPYLGGSFVMHDLTLGYQTLAARLHFDEFRLGFTSDSVSFTSTGGKLSDNDFAIAGMVRNFDNPTFNVKTRGTIQLAALLPFLDPAYNHKLSGTLRFDLQAVGQKSSWPETELTGVASLADVYYTNDSLTSPLEKLDTRMTFTGQGVKIDTLYAEYPGIRLSMTGSMRNGFAHLIESRAGYKKPYLDFRMHAPYVNYDVLVPAEEAPTKTVATGGSGGTGGPGETGGAVGSGEMAAPIFLPDIDAGGTAVIDTLIYSKVDFTDVKGDVTYKDGIIGFKNATGRLYTGTVAAEGTVDVNDFYNPVVACDFTANKIEANDFLERFADLGGHLYGKVDMKGKLTGQGSELPDFIKSMVANGTVDMSEGKLVNFKLVQDMAGQFGFKTFEDQNLRDLAGIVKIDHGSLVVDGGQVASQVGDWNVGGAVAFLEKKLNLNVDVYLSKEYADKAVQQYSQLGNMLLDDKGRIKVGFKVGGNFTQPVLSNFSVNKGAVKENVKEKVEDKAKDLIKGLIKKP